MKPLKLKPIACPKCLKASGVHKTSAQRALTSKQIAKYRKAQKTAPPKSRAEHLQVGRQRSLEELLTNAEVVAALQTNTSGAPRRDELALNENHSERILKVGIVLLSVCFFYLHFYHDLPYNSAKAMFLIAAIIAIWLSTKLDVIRLKRWYKQSQDAYEISRQQWICLRCFYEWERET